jgi:hypothetical protein
MHLHISYFLILVQNVMHIILHTFMVRAHKEITITVIIVAMPLNC